MKKFKENVEKIYKKEEETLALNSDFIDVSLEYDDLLSKIPFDKILKGKKLDHDASAEEISYVIEKLNKYPEWKKSQEVLNKRYSVKEKFFNTFIDLLILVDDCRKKITNKENLNKLLTNGELFYMYLLDNESIEKLNSIETYSNNNYELLEYVVLKFLGIDSLEEPTNEENFELLRQALISLKNEDYINCYKDLKVEIDKDIKVLKDYLKASVNENGLSNVEILGNRIDVDFYRDYAKNINEQYDRMENEVINKTSCVKLIIMYVNLLQLLYIVMNINILVEEFQNDLEIVHSQEHK